MCVRSKVGSLLATPSSDMEYEFETIFTCVLVSVVALFLTLAVFLRSSRISAKELIVLFIDAPDPDNPAAVAAVYKNVLYSLGRSATVHIVLTGRPVDLKTSKNKPSKSEPTSIARQEWEKDEPLHAQRLLEDSAARIHGYLAKCNVETRDIAIYDGGIAPTAPLSDVVHDWDFLFDRKDLITSRAVDQGEILSPHEYNSLVAQFSDLPTQEMEQKLLSVLRPYTLRPLTRLKKQMESKACNKVVIFLGGPATALVRLFRDNKTLHRKVASLYGMFGSLHPGKSTLLPNQFNVACDVEAACNLFIDNILPYTKKYLITTETAKNDIFMLSSGDLLEKGVPSYFVDLQQLWESTHEDKVQPMFDVLPVMSYMDEFKDCFKWYNKKAMLCELQGKGSSRQIFSFIDSDDDAKHIFVSDSSVQHLDKTKFLDFMHQVWSQ